MSDEKFSTILNVLEGCRDSEKIAFICGEEKITYRDLVAGAKHIARGLLAEGVHKGDRVLLCMEQGIDSVRGFLGILYAGCSYVATDPEWPEERINLVAKDAEVKFSLTNETCRKLFEKEPTSVELPEIYGEDEAAVYYTSGSTGKPKGTVLYHIIFGATLASRFSLNVKGAPDPADWQIAQCLFRFHFVGAICVYCMSFARQNTMILPMKEELSDIESLILSVKKSNADWIVGTTTLILLIAEHPSFSEISSVVKCISATGEKFIPSLVEKLSQANADILVTNTYGSSEMFINTESVCGDGKFHFDSSVILNGVEMYILDDNLEEVPTGEEGEIFIGGTPAKYGHYLNRPDLDAEKYVEHPNFGRLFRTGDIAYFGENGEIKMSGRRDGMVKLHGQRIEIGEIENAMSSFPGVLRAAAVLRKSDGQDTVCGFYTADRELDDREFRKHLAERLPMYMIPAFLRHIPEMPQNDHGKLDYRSLPAIEKEKPFVSVLTPFHNTPFELLERAGRSVSDQDYEPEKIRWLIAVHNMTEEDLNKVRETVGTSPNIQIFPLNEPKKLLGAVRNALLEKATGRYIFWLDADDELLPGSVSRSVKLMEESRSDILLAPCEEIHEGGIETFARVLNHIGKEPVVLEKGDPRINELVTGCAYDVWSACFRTSFLRETGMRFNDSDVGHYCDPLFTIGAIISASRVAVIPNEKNYRYHVRKSSDFQNRLQNDHYQEALEVFALQKAVTERAEEKSFDADRFIWSSIRSFAIAFLFANMSPQQKQSLRYEMLPYIKKLRVLSPCPAFPLHEAQYLTNFAANVFPEETANFKNPRYRHKQTSFATLPTQEKILSLIKRQDYIGFKTLPSGYNVYLGKVDDAATPEVVAVDLRGKSEDKQKSVMQSYRRIEKFRGFNAQEVPCRITRFILNDDAGELLVTWDERFLHTSVIGRLIYIFGEN